MPYGLMFHDADNDYVDCGNDSTLDALRAGTILAWVYPTTYLPSGQRVIAALDAGSALNSIDFTIGSTSGTRPLRILIQRATTSLNAEAAAGTLPALRQNNICCIGCQWNVDGGDTGQRVFAGDRWTPMAEPSSYANQTVGSGTHDHTGKLFSIGSSGRFDDLGFPGHIYTMGFWNRRLLVWELTAWQFAHAKARHKAVPNGLLGHWTLGRNGTGLVRDESGNGRHGLVTVASPGTTLPTLISRPPLPGDRRQSLVENWFPLTYLLVAN